MTMLSVLEGLLEELLPELLLEESETELLLYDMLDILDFFSEILTRLLGGFLLT